MASKSAVYLILICFLSVFIFSGSSHDPGLGPPFLDSLMPNSGSSFSNQPVTFTAVYGDPDGAAKIYSIGFQVSPTSGASSPIIGIIYLGSSQGPHTVLVGSGAQSNICDNSNPQVLDFPSFQLDCAQLSVVMQGNLVTVNWPFVFKAPTAGTKNLYMSAKEKGPECAAQGGASTGWVDMGDWTVLDQKEIIYIFANGKRVAMEESGEKYFVLSDHLGSSIVHLDNSGNEVSYTEYKSFGGVKSETSTKTFNKKFTGKELDESTGLYDYEARQYDTEIGRFITADTADPKLDDPQTLNRYSYTLNNPIKYIDPTGHAAESPYDIASAMLSAAEFSENPNLTNAAFLVADLIAVATPGLPAPGLALRTLGAANKINNLEKTAGVVEKGIDAANTFRGKSRDIVIKKGTQLSRAFEEGVTDPVGTFFMTKGTARRVTSTESAVQHLGLRGTSNAKPNRIGLNQALKDTPAQIGFIKGGGKRDMQIVIDAKNKSNFKTTHVKSVPKKTRRHKSNA